MQFTFEHSEPEAEHIRTFYFRGNKKPDFTAGQFTELELPHEKPDKRGLKRWFTLSSSPARDYYTITTKFAEKSSTFKKSLLALQPGSTIEAADPMGDFVLPKNEKTPLFFVAGGIGVTPFHSIIQWLEDTGQQRDIQLLYSAHVLEEVAFRELFEKAPIDFRVLLQEPPKDWSGLTGSLTGKLILKQCKQPEKALIYISGPEPMVESLQDELKNLGIPESHLVGDYFPNYTVI